MLLIVTVIKFYSLESTFNTTNEWVGLNGVNSKFLGYYVQKGW